MQNAARLKYKYAFWDNENCKNKGFEKLHLRFRLEYSDNV